MPYKEQEAKHEYYLRHREKILANNRQYYYLHRSEINAREKERRAANSLPPIIRPCGCCGKIMTLYPPLKKTKYCSDECKRIISNAQQRKQRQAKLVTERPCRYCGSLFTISPRRGGNYQYCSDECRKTIHCLRSKEYYQKNRQKIRVRWEKYYSDPSVRERARARAKFQREQGGLRRWKINNPHAVRLMDKRARSQRQNIYHRDYAEQDFIRQLAAQNHCDFYTDEPLFNGSIEPDISEEHIIPVSAGGPDIFENIVFIRRSTNSRKRHKSVSRFLTELVEEGVITREAADRKLAYIHNRLSGALIQTWLKEWGQPREVERLIARHCGKV